LDIFDKDVSAISSCVARHCSLCFWSACQDCCCSGVVAVAVNSFHLKSGKCKPTA